MIKYSIQTSVLLLTAFLTTQCQQPAKNTDFTADTDTTKTEKVTVAADTALQLTLRTKPNYKLSDSIHIDFIVTNPTTDTLSFTTYHTPFEGIISKFLSVTDENGKEVEYIGAMAKRVMPPPAETYRAVAPGEDITVSFPLKKGYKIDRAGSYLLQYTDENISGIPNSESVKITVTD